MKLKQSRQLNQKRYWQAMVLLLIALQCLLLLSGCGFRLRGSDYGVTKLDQAVYVQIDDSQSALLASLKNSLNLVKNRSEAQTVLTIISENRGRRVLSVASDGKVEEYELQYSVTFSATTHEGAKILPRQSVTLKRTYQFDESAVLAIETEESDLYLAMADDAAYQIARRLDVAVNR